MGGGSASSSLPLALILLQVVFGFGSILIHLAMYDLLRFWKPPRVLLFTCLSYPLLIPSLPACYVVLLDLSPALRSRASCGTVLEFGSSSAGFLDFDSYLDAPYGVGYNSDCGSWYSLG